MRRISSHDARNGQCFIRFVSDEWLRLELGAAVVAALALENVELSSERLSREVRRSIVERRAG